MAYVIGQFLYLIMTIGNILPLRYGKFEYLGQDASQTPLPEYMDYEKTLLNFKYEIKKFITSY